MQSITHFEIPCDDMTRAPEFYATVFGWETSSIPDMDYVMAQTTEVDESQRPTTPGAINGGFYKRSENASPSPVVVINVDDIQDSMDAINEEGGNAPGPVQRVGDTGLYTQFQDCEGNVLALWQSLNEGEGEGG